MTSWTETGHDVLNRSSLLTEVLHDKSDSDLQTDIGSAPTPTSEENNVSLLFIFAAPRLTTKAIEHARAEAQS